MGEFMSFLNWDVQISPQILQVLSHYYFLKFYLFIFGRTWVFVAAWDFRSCGERGLLVVAIRGLLTVVASLVMHKLL